MADENNIIVEQGNNVPAVQHRWMRNKLDETLKETLAAKARQDVEAERNRFPDGYENIMEILDDEDYDNSDYPTFTLAVSAGKLVYHNYSQDRTVVFIKRWVLNHLRLNVEPQFIYPSYAAQLPQEQIPITRLIEIELDDSGNIPVGLMPYNLAMDNITKTFVAEGQISEDAEEALTYYMSCLRVANLPMLMERIEYQLKQTPTIDDQVYIDCLGNATDHIIKDNIKGSVIVADAFFFLVSISKPYSKDKSEVQIPAWAKNRYQALAASIGADSLFTSDHRVGDYTHFTTFWKSSIRMREIIEEWLC